MMIRTLTALLCTAPMLLHAQEMADSVAPEVPMDLSGGVWADEVAASLSAKAAGQPVTASNWMVVAANPLAVAAGARVLEAGGSAADAMVAVQAVLGLVEPQSSGLGGGAFLVWYDAGTGRLTTLDGRETAPLEVTPLLFQTEDGERMSFWDAVIGGRSVGTPGTPALMDGAHERWGRLPWESLFQEAIALAEDGFTVSPRLAGSIASGAERLARYQPTADYFMPDGIPLEAGATLRNPAYAETLRQFAEGRSEAFYAGRIAEGIVDTVQGFDENPGDLQMLDLAIYRIKERDAVCAEYRGHDVCGMGPPSSGALTVGQILGQLNGTDLAALGPDNPEAWRRIGEASRLAFADRGRYMADSDFVPVPVEGLVDPAYLAERARLFEESDGAADRVSPGKPEFSHTLNWADDDAIERPSTSHISIVDAEGNALSMTTTIENSFGSRLMAPGGFLLNNELTDFSFRSHVDGVPVANRVEPGKRPRSSMAPTIVLKDGRPVLVIGSPGGSRIIGYVTQAIIAQIDWGMDPQKAVAMGHAVNRFGTYDLEEGTDVADLQGALEALGYEVSVRGLNSGLHAIRLEDGLIGGADPRREGIALGE